MNHLKLFEEFSNSVYEYYYPNNRKSSFIEPTVSPDWFTKEDIEALKQKAESLGIEIAKSSKQDPDNFFGDSSGRGITESVIDFFTRGGNLCNEVNISTTSGNYTITKNKGTFTLNGKNVGDRIEGVISIIR